MNWVQDGNNRDTAFTTGSACGRGLRVGGAFERSPPRREDHRVAPVRVWQRSSRCPVQPLSPLSPCRPINRHEDPNPRLLGHFLTDDGDERRFIAL